MEMATVDLNLKHRRTIAPLRHHVEHDPHQIIREFAGCRCGGGSAVVRVVSALQLMQSSSILIQNSSFLIQNS